MPWTDFSKALVRALEQGLGVAGGLLVDCAHRFGGALALSFGVLADAFVLFADGTGAFGAGFRDETGDLAGARRSGIERLVQQAGESGQALLDILGADIEGGDQGIELDTPLVDARPPCADCCDR